MAGRQYGNSWERDRREYRYSVVIPVFNSQAIVGTTIDKVVEVFDGQGLDFEVIAVDDGSSDDSWEVLQGQAAKYPQVVALRMLKNYGQHYANLAGFREATGHYVITLDDDLQNPPDQALLLIDRALEGHDVVFGEFEQKQASGYRRLGSTAVAAINRRIFGQPPELVVSNFRIIRHDVVARICADNSAFPYVTGQALIYSRSPANVTVRHDPRISGKSSYSAIRIARLVFTILFSYSLFPLRAMAGIGFAVSLLSFIAGGVYLGRGLLIGTQVEGWTSLVVLLAVFNGFTIALLSMLGEYVIRTLNSVSTQDRYHVISRKAS